MTTAHECNKGHGPMVEREHPDKLAASLGTWFDCAHHNCRDSVLVPIPVEGTKPVIFVHELNDMARAEVAR